MVSVNRRANPVLSDYRVTPGSDIRRALKREGITESDLADHLGKSTAFIVALLRGTKQITALLAEGPMAAFSVPAHVRVNLERLYRAGQVISPKRRA